VYLCVNVYIYIYMYICIYVHIYTLHLSRALMTRPRIDMHICRHHTYTICIHVSMDIYIHVQMYIYVYIYTYKLEFLAGRVWCDDTLREGRAVMMRPRMYMYICI